AVGASVTLWKEGETLKRWVQAGQGRLDSHSLRLHFGLGESTSIDSLLVEWPSGNTHFFVGNQIPIDVIWTITEDINLSTNRMNEIALLSVYPNPASISFAISYKKARTPFQLSLLNMQSQIILQKHQVYSNETIQLPSSIKPGVYILRLINDDMDRVVKLVVK
ncbi:MAG: T9SS type A sorting domain-containing protein, partial [Bacteroidales bacterium]|nr:T9SS type A sorting domain-containing protein [Bacteroidales bacterium]